jgi:hypothetical protein
VGKQNQEKFNWLQRSLPDGLVADAKWLEKNGYSGALRKKYVAHGWLDRVARGVYRRPTPQLPEEGAEKGVPWESVVISLQTLLKAHFVVGGRTALELQGFAHYLSLAPQREVHLYGTDKRPGWVLKLNLESRFVFHNAKRLFVSQVPASPEPTTVHSLLQRSEPAHWHKTMARQINFDVTGGHKLVEGTVWKLTDVELVEWKTEGDHDVHLVVKDKGGPQDAVLDVEFPGATCQGTISSPVKAQIAKARAALLAACGQPTSNYKPLSGTATIEGFGFFDKSHSAPSTIEVHPALRFSGECH